MKLGYNQRRHFPQSTFRSGESIFMKYFAAAALVLVIFGLNAFAQTDGSTRPRVAPTATPPVINNDPYRPDSSKKAPVLIGGRSQTSTAKPEPTQSADDDGGVIRVETNLVTMPVSVLDRDGRFISGLQQKDFQIFENGIEQKVDYFQSVEQPFTVVLLIDVSPSTQFRIDEIQNAAIAFLDQLRPSDRVMVIAFDESVHVLSPVTNNRNELRNAIRESRFGDGTGLYEAVDYVISQQMRRIQGRKAVVLFTDGVDTTSRRASYQSTIKDAEEVDSLFYTIRYDTSQDMGGGRRYPYPQRRRQGRVTMADVLGAILSGGNVYTGGSSGGPGATEYETGRKYLEELARTSGGRKFEAQSIYNVDAAFSGIAEELRRQYSLGYYPETVGNVGERKQIKVRVLRPGVVVRAKTSYIVGQNNRNLAGK